MKQFKTVEERNEYLKETGHAGYDKAFSLTFRDRKKNFFMVVYGEHGHNFQNPYFATSAGTLNFHRTDWESAGQGQDSILKNRKLRKFFKKWDHLHLKMLTLEQFEEMQNDLNELKASIPYIESTSFYNIAQFDREESK